METEEQIVDTEKRAWHTPELRNDSIRGDTQTSGGTTLTVPTSP
jgi:hypothetical protein